MKIGSSCERMIKTALKRATDEGSLPEIAQYSPYNLTLNVFMLPKGQTIIFYLLTLSSTQPVRYFKWPLLVVYVETEQT